MDSHYHLHHVAILVEDLPAAIERYRTGFELREHLREELPEFGATVAFLTPRGAHEENSTIPTPTAIELLSPLGPESPLATTLKKRGEGLHHICYEVSDIAAELTRLAALGHHLIDQTPRKGAHGNLVAFLHPKSAHGVLTELCQNLKGV
ncbi:methylmalonyl-CoA epimerase [bacterium]|nr:methylmalonyl-CoA epimerase [bacterium]